MKLMMSVRISLAVVAIAGGFASCAQPEKAAVVLKALPVGSRFDEVGKVSMYAGQPCTPQIMFDFQTRGGGRSVWIAARMNETKLLTNAAAHGTRVHVWGTWRRGTDKGCNYVSVTQVTVTK